MWRFFFSVLLFFLVVACTGTGPPSVLDEKAVADYVRMRRLRAQAFESAAYLVDLRINNDGKKFSVNTEIFFSGDSVGFYGRGYLGRGAFKGNIIDNRVTVYFPSEDRFFSEPLDRPGRGVDCTDPAEVLLYVLSLVAGDFGRDEADDFRQATVRGRRIEYPDGRFTHSIRLNRERYPVMEKLVDPICRDSIVFRYGGHSREFPYYKPNDILYYNGESNFRARGFIREQKYNVAIAVRKFRVTIPPTAEQLDAI